MANWRQKLIAWAAGKTLGYFDRIYGENTSNPVQLSNPYAESVWVMRGIKHVATPIASVPIVFSENDVQLDDTDLEMFWEDPFLNMSFYDGIEATVGWLKLKGECFWVADDSWLVPFPSAKKASKLLIARPDRMKAVLRDDELLGWEYTTQSGRREVFLPEQVWQHKFWNPYDSLHGLAEMKAAKNAAESDYLAGLFKRNLMRSNGDRGIIVVGKHGIPDDAQRKQIIEQIRMKQRANQRGEARALFLSGDDFSIEDPKIQVPDAAFHAGRIQDRHEIYAAFGIPLSMADVQSSFSIGSASDRFRLIEDTCMPTGAKVMEGVEFFGRKQSERPRLKAGLDWDEHSVMQAVRAERIESAGKLADRGMPMKEISEYMRLNLPEYPGWEVGYLPFNVQPVSAVTTDATKDPKLAEKSRHVTSKSFDEMVNALKGSAAASSQRTEPEEENFQDTRDAAEIKLWKQHMADRRASVKRFESGFRRVLFEARKETLQKLEASGDLLKAINKAAASDFVFDLEVFRTAFFGAMRKASQTAFMAGGTQVLNELSIDDPFETPPEKVLLFLQNRENLLKNIPDEVHSEIMGTLTEGINAGESTAKLAGRVREAFNAIDSARANTIAQTETAAAYGNGRQTSMEQSGVKYKKWLTSGNANVRPSHRAANGQVVRVDQDFEVGGTFLKHPCDHSGPAAETINCHCVSIAVANKED